jgi:plastocyanin
MQRRSTTRALALAAAALLALGLAACGDDDDDAADTGDEPTTTEAEDTGTTTADGVTGGEAAGDATVVAQDFSFTVPDSVAVGATVTFDNQDSAPHTMTADDDAFDSGNVTGGSQGEVTAPSEAGDYAFHCEIHPNMTATLTVA